MLKPFFDHQGITVFHGRAEEVCKGFANGAFGAIITDPPLGTMRPESYVDFFIERDMVRLVDDLDGKILAMTSPSPGYVEMTLAPPTRLRTYLSTELVPVRSADHPHERPVGPVKKLVQATQGPILDPYMGSGTTLVAALELGRFAVGIEIEEKYCVAAVLRLKKSIEERAK